MIFELQIIALGHIANIPQEAVAAGAEGSAPTTEGDKKEGDKKEGEEKTPTEKK